MSGRVSVESQIREILRDASRTRRDCMHQALELLVRRCDAKLPLIPPSLLDAPLTLEVWKAFLAREAIAPNRRGDAMEALAAPMRNALSNPRCENLEKLVRSWLPDEDPLREVAIVTRDVVADWWNDPARTISWYHHAVFTPLRSNSVRLALEACVIESARSLADAAAFDVPFEIIDEALASDDEATRSDGLVALERFLRAQVIRYEDIAARFEAEGLEPIFIFVDDEPIEVEDYGTDDYGPPRLDTVRGQRDMAVARQVVCKGLADVLVAVARGDRHVVYTYTNARQRFVAAAIPRDDAVDDAIIRRHFDVPDLERALVESTPGYASSARSGP